MLRAEVLVGVVALDLHVLKAGQAQHQQHLLLEVPVVLAGMDLLLQQPLAIVQAIAPFLAANLLHGIYGGPAPFDNQAPLVT